MDGAFQSSHPLSSTIQAANRHYDTGPFCSPKLLDKVVLLLLSQAQQKVLTAYVS